MNSAIKGVARVDGRTLGEAYLRRVQLTPSALVYQSKKNGLYTGTTWEEFHQYVLGLFHFYEKSGVKVGDRVCIMSQSRPEWMHVDYANVCYGAITVPIYHSNTVEDIAFILKDCDAKLVFVENNDLLLKLNEAMQILKQKIPNVVFDGKSYAEIAQAPAGEKKRIAEALRARVATFNEQGPASIVYTSGTTGQPKGVVLRHQNFVHEIRTLVEQVDVGPSDSTLTFLPFAHIMGRVESTLPIFSGAVLNFAESISSVAADIAVAKPTLLISVPRIYEKIYSKIQSDVEQGSEVKRGIFNWAVKVGQEVVRVRSEHKSVPLLLQAKFKVADQLVFSKVRNKLGGRVRMTISGGAPLSRELCEFFHSCGIKVLEAYGLTETTAAITCNHPDDYCFGTVGKPIAGVELKIAEDGEILVRGPVVFNEYHGNVQATQEAFADEKWFRTGDIGLINARGFLKITDRKKELIVTSGGKNVAPQKLENLLKNSRYISNAMVYGDKQKYLVALITLSEPEVIAWAKAQKLSYTNIGDLAARDEIVNLIQGEVKSVNSGLASFESIKKTRIVPVDFAVETGELTPSLKLKRKVITAKYQAVIESMYG